MFHNSESNEPGKHEYHNRWLSDGNLKTWQRDSGDKSETFVRNEASWREMLIIQPSFTSLSLAAGDGSRSLTDETGMRMGISNDDAERAEYGDGRTRRGLSET